MIQKNQSSAIVMISMRKQPLLWRHKGLDGSASMLEETKQSIINKHHKSWEQWSLCHRGRAWERLRPHKRLQSVLSPTHTDQQALCSLCRQAVFVGSSGIKGPWLVQSTLRVDPRELVPCHEFECETHCTAHPCTKQRPTSFPGYAGSHRCP